jgi:ankyrin repeat protein
MLLEQPGIDVNAEMELGWTALMMANQNGHTEIIKLLKQYPIEQILPNLKKRQEDRDNLAMVMHNVPVERKYGRQRFPPEIEHEAMKHLGGKRKTKKATRKSKRKTRKNKRKSNRK